MSGPTKTPRPVRVVAFVDGFNLYYGIKSKGWGRYRWLDVKALVSGFIREPQQFDRVVYFTARSTAPAGRYQRHTTYLNALARGTGVDVIEGTMHSRPRSCPECGHVWKRNQEKQTDVKIAMEMVTTAIDKGADEFFLLSADSDLVPVVELVQTRFEIPVTILDPPARHSAELAAVGARRLRVARPKLAQAQLPNPVVYVHRGRSDPSAAQWSETRPAMRPPPEVPHEDYSGIHAGNWMETLPQMRVSIARTMPEATWRRLPVLRGQSSSDRERRRRSPVGTPEAGDGHAVPRAGLSSER